MSHEDYLKERICSNCHMTLLRDHEKVINGSILKCPTCGYTKVVIRPEYDYIAKKFKNDDTK